MPSSDEILAVLNAVDARALERGVEALSDTERALHLVSSLFFEVQLGGFTGYYYNSAGNNANEAVWALEEMGAFQTAGSLRRINELFPGGAPAKDREQRFEQMQLLRRRSDNPFERVSDEFDHSPEDIDLLIEQYIEAHWPELSGLIG